MATYYVKTGGGTGTGLDDASAWSYAKLNATNTSGHTVLFKRGDTFTGALNNSGNTTYGAYGTGANPILSGFTTLSSWTLSSGNIYYADLDVAVLHGVTLDGAVKGMGRYPKSGHLTYSSHSNNTSITGTSIGALPFNAVGAEVVIRKVRWILDRQVVTDHTGNTLTYNALQTYGNNNIYHPFDGNGYFIQGHLSCLTEDGDWYYDNGANRLYMYFTATPSGRSVKASTVDRIFWASTNTSFTDVDFEGANYGLLLDSSTNITVTDCNFRKQGISAMYLYQCDSITISGGSISDSLNNGIFGEWDADNVTITGMEITNSGAIIGAGRSGDGGYTGIFLAGNGNQVSGNRVINSGFNGIHFTGDNILVEENYVDTFCFVKDDGAGIYTVIDNNTASNRVIQNNIVLNAIGAFAMAEGYTNEAFGKVAAIYLDDFTNNVIVTGNVLAHGPYGGIWVNGNGNNEITNNLIYDFAYQLFIVVYDTTRMRNLTVSGNVLIAKTAEQSSLCIELRANDTISLFGSFSGNTYSRPVDDTDSITVSREYIGSGITTYTLAGWKSLSGLDADSQKSAYTISDPDDITFHYNDTDSDLIVDFEGSRKDVANNIYTESITLDPYSAIVMLQYSSIRKILRNAANGKLLRNPATGNFYTIVS